VTADRLSADLARARRDEEDAAAVVAVVTALAAQSRPTAATPPRSFWGDPAHRLGITRPGVAGWWISGQPR